MFITIAKLLYNDSKEQKLKKLDPTNEYDYIDQKPQKLTNPVTTKEKGKSKCKC